MWSWGRVHLFLKQNWKGSHSGAPPLHPARPLSFFLRPFDRMDQHVKRFTHFQETGDRLLPPPPMYDLDPVTPPYVKFGQEGHVYIVKPPGLDEDQFVFKIGSTTQLLKRLYWYEPGTELMYSLYVPNSLRSIELQWIKRIRRDQRFRLVKGREYFSGPWEGAIEILNEIRQTS